MTVDGSALLAAWATFKSGTLWHNPNVGKPNHPCNGYADANPGEAAILDTYVNAVAAGQTPNAPMLNTLTGEGLVGIISTLAFTAAPPPPPPPPSAGVWWAGPVPAAWEFPAATPTLPDIVDQGGLQALLKTGSTQHGVVRVRPFTYTGLLDLGARSSGLVVVIEDGWKLIGPAASAYPAVEAHSAGVMLYGGDVSNPHGGSGTSGGDGVKVKVNTSDPSGTDITWKGLKIHDTAAQGFSVQGSRFPIHCDVDVEVSRWGLNTSLDPHKNPGTGLHGSYIGGGLTPSTGTYVIYAHDGATGAGCEAGANLQNAELWLSVADLGWTKDDQAGAGLMPWGGSNGTVTVKNLLVDGAQLAVYCGSLSSGLFKIEFGRYKNIRLSPPYQTSSHIAYGDWKLATALTQAHDDFIYGLIDEIELEKRVAKALSAA